MTDGVSLDDLLAHVVVDGSDIPSGPAQRLRIAVRGASPAHSAVVRPAIERLLTADKVYAVTYGHRVIVCL